MASKEARHHTDGLSLYNVNVHYLLRGNVKHATGIWLLFTCILCAFSAQAADKKQLSAALAAVEANLKTGAGKEYDAALAKQLSPYTASIRQCKQSNASSSFAPFDIFLELKSDGKVEQALAYPETALAVCTRDALSSAQFSAPPRGDYWVNIHLELKK